METNLNESLWRVQLGTGEIRMMTLDGLDQAFENGVIDARTPVLPPGASAWTTLGEAAGLEDAGAAPRQQDQSPSLSPVAISAPSMPSMPPSHAAQLEAPLDLELPDNFEELRPRRKGLVIGGLAAGAAALVMAAVVVARLGASMPTNAQVPSTNAVQAPPPAAETLPPAAPKAEEPKDGAKPALSDWQKRMLIENDKAREDKARAKKEKAVPAARPQPKKGSAGLLNGGDRFDPLNGAL